VAIAPAIKIRGWTKIRSTDRYDIRMMKQLASQRLVLRPLRAFVMHAACEGGAVKIFVTCTFVPALLVKKDQGAFGLMKYMLS
jgi:hypothetical protein